MNPTNITRQYLQSHFPNLIKFKFKLFETIKHNISKFMVVDRRFRYIYLLESDVIALQPECFIECLI